MGWFNHQLVCVEFPSFTKHSAATKTNDPGGQIRRFRDVEEAQMACQSRGGIPRVSKCLVTLQGGPIGSDGYNPYK